MQDIYFEANYGKLYEKMEDGKSEYYEFSNQYGSITNVFIKREVPIRIDSEEQYYDITTPYGYGGPIIKKVVKGKKTELVESYKEDFKKYCLKNKIFFITFYKFSFKEDFKKYCLKNNIVSEFIRFHPVFGNEKPFKNIYDVE